jgi:hypothetical protein
MRARRKAGVGHHLLDVGEAGDVAQVGAKGGGPGCVYRDPIGLGAQPRLAAHDAVWWGLSSATR